MITKGIEASNRLGFIKSANAKHNTPTKHILNDVAAI